MDGLKGTSLLLLLFAQDPVLYPIMRQAKIGFIDRQGKVVIEPKFYPMGAFDSGKTVFSEGLEPVAKDFTTWGYINRNGEVKIPFQFSLAEPFSEGLAAVRVGAKYGYIDHSGTLKIPAMFDYAGAFSAGVTSVVVNGKTGYIDKTGSFLIKPQFTSWSPELSTFSEGLAGASQDGLWGFIDKKGAWAIPPQYKEIGPFHDGLAAVNQKGELNYKYIDHSGATVLGPFDLAWRFSEGLARVNLHGRSAFINRQGDVQFTLAQGVWWTEPFAEGLAKVQFRAEPSGAEKIGYINQSGKFVIPAIYQAGFSFQNGLAFVSMCGQSGYIGKNGEPVWGIKPRVGPARSQPAPSSKILTPELLAKITHHPGPLILKELPVSDGCDPFGKKVWSLAVSTADQTFHPLTINLVEGGTFLTDERIGNLKALQERFSSLSAGSQSFARAIDPAKKLTGYASVGGFGPGGSEFVASIFSPDRQYEVQVQLLISFEGDVIKTTTDQTKDYAAQVKDPLGFVNSVGLEILSKLFPAGKGTQEQP